MADTYSFDVVSDFDRQELVNTIDQLRQTPEAAGLPVFALAQSRPSLDDVYLQATGRTLMDAELAIAGQRDVKQEKRQSMR